ncbi:TPA: hypothetical protein DCZ77_03310 [Patescibacteria group bacterium]|nr:hypothetical protein [Patescibacteria group bacterium]
MKKALTLSMVFFLMFTSLSHAFAQQTVLPPQILNVARNNDPITIFEGNKIYGLSGDAIRIGGSAKPGDKITVYVADREYPANLDQFNNWFVLFSITNFTEEQYSIEGKATNNGIDSEKVELLTLIVGEEPTSVEQAKQDTENTDSKKNIDPRNVIIAILTVLILIAGWLLLSPKIIKRK